MKRKIKIIKTRTEIRRWISRKNSLQNYAKRTSIEEKREEKDKNSRIIRKWTKTKRRTKKRVKNRLIRLNGQNIKDE